MLLRISLSKTKNIKASGGWLQYTILFKNRQDTKAFVRSQDELQFSEAGRSHDYKEMFLPTAQ